MQGWTRELWHWIVSGCGGSGHKKKRKKRIIIDIETTIKEINNNIYENSYKRILFNKYENNFEMWWMVGEAIGGGSGGSDMGGVIWGD